MSLNQAVAILEELEGLQAEGVCLPYSPQFILQMEIRGHVVDLDTGEIKLNEADRPQYVEVTELGEEVASLPWEEDEG